MPRKLQPHHGYAEPTPLPGPPFSSLDVLITKLRLLRVQHGGALIVVVRTLNRDGTFVYGEANARFAPLRRVPGGLRESSALSEPVIETICLG